ncbi:hypothetical protein D7X33_40265 [Butyricicoccus sp. 1XD8-22]|nr:hypothetical protein D7X33_40265 [Butyricicoccus sp. 1XD8-22]
MKLQRKNMMQFIKVNCFAPLIIVLQKCHFAAVKRHIIKHGASVTILQTVFIILIGTGEERL